MSLPSWLLRVDEENERHVHVSVFVGPDADHRAHSGRLVLDREQADDLFDQVTFMSHRFEVRHHEPRPG